MISLLIDTCTNNVVIGLLKDRKLIDQIIEINDHNLSGKFTTMVEEIITKNGFVPNDIDNVFVAIGPGSFTGIRIGVTFAKVFAWSLHKKVIPFSSLELMATTAKGIVVPLIDARRGYVFAGIYDENLNSLMDDKYILLENLNKKIADYGTVNYISLDKFGFKVIKPNVDIEMLVNKHFDDPGVNPHSLNPNYLKKTEAEEKLIGE